MRNACSWRRLRSCIICSIISSNHHMQYHKQQASYTGDIAMRIPQHCASAVAADATRGPTSANTSARMILNALWILFGVPALCPRVLGWALARPWSNGSSRNVGVLTNRSSRCARLAPTGLGLGLGAHGLSGSTTFRSPASVGRVAGHRRPLPHRRDEARVPLPSGFFY
jgi:hypothetical protein